MDLEQITIRLPTPLLKDIRLFATIRKLPEEIIIMEALNQYSDKAKSELLTEVAGRETPARKKPGRKSKPAGNEPPQQ